ncbi:glycosyltransferase family 2 protein [Clostridium sp. NSJ-6]|uniref:Glycosyltransferase family 2 protein n=1 Tax=Clostridium hominis TaxID=2763036 RepID=A0ABR7D9H0_9CLOT|nr:glycosyltransferase family 2 protein [Clostridium hominis]MDU2673187.1 glycosyltransferase family 2 protein [Clostridium sp.]
MPKISVIVPVYNTENYIGRCIDSILNQSFSNFELILINDGSNDRSSEIIKNYEDNRIVFIDNNNNGVSETRNIGIKAAKGEYIQFVDSDDFIDKDMLKDTLKLLEDSNADCVMTGLYLDIEQDSKISTSTQTFEYFEAENKKDIALNVLARMGGTYINSPINKLYKRNIIIENNIFMDKSIDLGEDFLFNLMYLKFCNKVIFSDKCYYHYWMKIENNLTFKFRENKLDLMYLMYKKSEEYFKLSRLSKDEYRDLNNLFIKWMYSCFIDLHNSGCNLTYKEKIKYLKEAIVKYDNIIKGTNNLGLVQRILKLTLKYPSIVLLISKIMYTIKVKYRNLIYR